MQCPRCRAENREGRRFCGECGLSFASACPSCGFLNEGSERFCGGCGKSLPAGPTTAEPRFKSPEPYTPKHLAEKILTSKSALEGERKQVTVLFADLKGSMELLADRDPEEARKILDPVLERMMEAVHRYEGTVNQVMGDGVMALFGAPLAHEDHAVRACYAALRMQESVKRYAEGVQRAAGVPIQIRVGLNSGEVVVRAIGSDLRMDYTAVGQTTHLAARMEQMGNPGTVLITADTLRLAGGYVQVQPLGATPVKGLNTSVEVYELTGKSPVRSRLQAAAARGLTTFVGRDAEMDTLFTALEQAKAGKGQVVAVVGEPGVGKSRLFWEFTHSDRTHGCLLLEAASVSYGKATPYLPVIDLLKGYFQIEARDDTQKIREKVTGKLLSLGRALEAALPPLLSLFDVPVEDPQWAQLDPPVRRQRTLEAVKGVLERESLAQPVLLVFEDLHWIDSETHSMLDSLVESIPTVRALLLVNYRPEYQHRWGGKTYYTQLRLDPLPLESVTELLDTLVGSDLDLQPLRRLLIERTAGNPFFLEESVGTLIETGVLLGERGAYRLARAVPATLLPPTIQAVLAARIDRLASEEKQLLQTAAVIGTNIPLPLLEAIAGLPSETLRQGLGQLQRAEFLYETQLFPDIEYTFKHALTHEVAYGGLMQQRRRELHARIVGAIETLHGDRLGEQIERLAHHARHGEVWDKALTYLRQAGLKAFAHSSYREAVTWFEEALTALERMPRTPKTLECAIDLRFDLRNSLLPLGEHARYYFRLQEAETLARELGDQHRLGWVAAYTAAYLYLMGQQRGALESGQRALKIAEALGDSRLEVPSNTWVGQAYYYSGEYRRASAFFRRNVERLVGDLSRERFGLPQLPSVHSRTCLVWCLTELGDLEEGIRFGHEALRLAQSVDHPLSIAVACAGLGALLVRKGEVEEAIVLLESALEVSRSWNVLLWFPRIASALGSAYTMAGRAADAVPLLRQAVAQAASMGLMGGHSQLVRALAEGLLVAGDIAEAGALAASALELARQHKERGCEAWALRLPGEIALCPDGGDQELAEHSCREALTLAETLEMRLLVAHARLTLGRLMRHAERRTEAAVQLAGAVALFRKMDLTPWARQAEREVLELH